LPQVYVQLTAKEEKGQWTHFGLIRNVKLDLLMDGSYGRIPGSVTQAYNLYKSKVGFKLGGAFHNDVKQPDMESLVEAATCLGLKGEPNDVLKALAPHLQREKTRLNAYWDGDGRTQDKAELHRRELTLDRYTKAYGMLLRPEERIKKQFKKAMLKHAPWMLPPPPAQPPAPPPAPPPSMPALMPPGSAVVPFVPPPTDPPPPLNTYLSCRVLPRNDCAKCRDARGGDASVREGFTTDAGRGRKRKISDIRACPLSAHAINAADGVELLEQYERDYGVKLANKKQKFIDFMRDVYCVGRLGKHPSFAVSLYTPPRVDVGLSLDGGNVKLALTGHGYEVDSNARPKDNFAGFYISEPSA